MGGTDIRWWLLCQTPNLIESEYRNVRALTWASQMKAHSIDPQSISDNDFTFLLAVHAAVHKLDSNVKDDERDMAQGLKQNICEVFHEPIWHVDQCSYIS